MKLKRVYEKNFLLKPMCCRWSKKANLEARLMGILAIKNGNKEIGSLDVENGFI